MVDFPEPRRDADGQRAEYVGSEGAKGEGFKTREAHRQSVAAEAAEGAAEGNAKPSHARDVHARTVVGEGFLSFYLGGVKG